MTKDQEFHQRVRFQYLYCVANKALTKSRKRARVLRSENKKLLTAIARWRSYSSEQEQALKEFREQRDLNTLQNSAITDLLQSVGPFVVGESLYANVAAALARASVRK